MNIQFWIVFDLDFTINETVTMFFTKPSKFTDRPKNAFNRFFVSAITKRMFHAKAEYQRFLHCQETKWGEQ